MSSLMQLSKQEIEECQEIVNNFRVNELHMLLTQFHYPKLGKKQDLVNRAQSILSNPKYQLSAVQRVREIQTNSRIRNAAQPYASSNMQSSSVSGDSMMRRQQYQSGIGSVTRNNQIPAQSNQNAYLNYNNGYGHQYAQQYGQHGQHSSLLYHQQQQVQQASMNTGTTQNIRNLRTVDLPFYNVRSVVVGLTELPSFSVPPRPGEARYQTQFGIPHDDIQKVYYRGDDHPLPRYEIQFRMFLLDTNAEQPDAFPPGCVVRVDDFNVTLPNIIPTNKPNAEQKRLSRPVNLTPYCHPPRGRERPHRLVIEWNGDKRAWAFGIFIVHRVNSQTLQERILLNVNAKRPFDTTKNTIIRRLRGTDDDDGIEMDTLKISLLCPLMRTPIKIPVRAADCTHLQSFDLTNYLMMCEKRPVWKCPVCDNNALYSKLIIDEYFQTLLKSVGPSVEDVELLKDGTWRIMKEDFLSISDDENEDIVVASSSKTVKKAVAAAPKEPEKAAGPASKAQDSDEVIVLSDSDDDFPSNFNAIRVESGHSSVSLEAQGRKSSSPPTYKIDGTDDSARPNGRSRSDQSCGSSDHSIICLDEDNENINVNNRSRSSSSFQEASSAPPSVPPTLPSVCSSSSLSNGQPTPAVENSWNQSRANHMQPQQNQSPQLAYTGGANPVLQTNGFHPPVFRPVIDEIAKAKVAQELAAFLQSVCHKNSNSITNTA
ncbi:PINIT domain-containing protein [Ditylenchus destructor]|nr:PINIT domain-containing protein [Ditylenchus destructor]